MQREEPSRAPASLLLTAERADGADLFGRPMLSEQGRETNPEGRELAARWEECIRSAPAPRLPHPASQMLTQRSGAHGSFFVSDAHRVAYMDIPRAASTSLRGVMRDLGAPIRRRLQQTAVFNNSNALRTLTRAQSEYFKFTFVASPLHHLVDGFAFVRNGGPDGPFNVSDAAWTAYRR